MYWENIHSTESPNILIKTPFFWEVPFIGRDFFVDLTPLWTSPKTKRREVGLRGGRADGVACLCTSEVTIPEVWGEFFVARFFGKVGDEIGDLQKAIKAVVLFFFGG